MNLRIINMVHDLNNFYEIVFHCIAGFFGVSASVFVCIFAYCDNNDHKK